MQISLWFPRFDVDLPASQQLAEISDLIRLNVSWVPCQSACGFLVSMLICQLPIISWPESSWPKCFRCFSLFFQSAKPQQSRTNQYKRNTQTSRHDNKHDNQRNNNQHIKQHSNQHNKQNNNPQQQTERQTIQQAQQQTQQHNRQQTQQRT